jgi:NitT/TauT family transport system substrate-binding protein
MGMLHMMEHNHENTFDLLGSPMEITPLLIRGDIDIAAVPANLASVLYNQTDGAIQALAVVTLGVLHIVDATGEINEISDLRGRTIFATGEGATPEFALHYVLRQNNLIPNEDVFIDFRTEATEIAALFELGLAEVALLPEPFASTVAARFPHLHVSLDLTKEWEKVQPDFGLIMSVVIGRRAFLEENPQALANFLAEYEKSIQFMTANTVEAAQLAVDAGLIPNINIAQAALPRTHMVFLTGEEMQRNLMGFYRVLYNESPASVGGRLPDEDFFFAP